MKKISIFIISLITVFTISTITYGATILFPYQGGTGSGNTPSTGDLLIGSSTGIYDQLSTSTNLGYVLTATSSEPFIAWEAVTASASAGGSDGQIQYNNGGVFAGANISYSSSTGYLGIGTTTPSSALDVIGNLEVSGTSTLGTVISGTWNGTNIGVSYGGTGSSDASTARTNLGLAIGSDVQAWDDDLDDLSGLTPTKGDLITTAGTDWTDLNVGSDGEVLTASSTAANGISWESAGAGYWEQNGSNIYYNGGYVGIGTDSPQWALEVSGIIVSSSTYPSYVLSNSNSGVESEIYLNDSGDINWYIYNPSSFETTTNSITIGEGNNSFVVDATSTIFANIKSGFLKTDDNGKISTSTIDFSDDTNATGGRSITLDGDAIDADSELYTDTKCIWFENPTADDDFKSIWRSSQAITFTKIWAESDQTVNFNFQEDDGTPADILSSDLSPAAGTASSTTFSDSSFAADSRLDLAITSVSGTPTWLSACWTYEKSD